MSLLRSTWNEKESPYNFLHNFQEKSTKFPHNYLAKIEIPSYVIIPPKHFRIQDQISSLINDYLHLSSMTQRQTFLIQHKCQHKLNR